MSDSFGETERVPRAGEPEETEDAAVERTANKVADELRDAKRKGTVVVSLQQLVRTTLQAPPDGLGPMAEKRAWSLMMPVMVKLQAMSERPEDFILRNALNDLKVPSGRLQKFADPDARMAAFRKNQEKKDS